jgi:hypothetical protein
MAMAEGPANDRGKGANALGGFDVAAGTTSDIDDGTRVNSGDATENPAVCDTPTRSVARKEAK